MAPGLILGENGSRTKQMAKATPIALGEVQGRLIIRAPAMDDPWNWLAAGWRDIWRNPALSLGYGAAFVAIGLVVTVGLRSFGLESVAPALAAGFTLLGPVLAIGLYEMSRRYEAGEPVSLYNVAAVHVPAPTQLAFLAYTLILAATGDAELRPVHARRLHTVG
jgi:uncharacterized membrane protein